MKEKVIIFGVGKNYQLYKTQINDNFRILAIVDNDINIQNTEVDGYIVISADQLQEFEYDLILVTEVGDKSVSVKKQLLNMRIPISKMRFTGNGGIEPYRINPLFFKSGLCYDEKKLLFSENIERVIIELNSKCNRKCWFCTNSLFHDEHDNIDMSDSVFEKIISELEQINYRESICLSFFNEPLLSRKFLGRIEELRRRLPDAFIYAFSNGDFLSKEALARLEKAGLNRLIIDIYTNGMEYNYEESIETMHSLECRTGLKFEIWNSRNGFLDHKMYGNLEVMIYSQNFMKSASNRAESLINRGLPIPVIEEHPLPCIKSFISYNIDYRGDVWPCPNYHREYEAHRQYCIGNVCEETIFDIYIGDKMNAYRKKNFFERDSLPCRSCIWNFNSFKENSFFRPFSDRVN